jgi:tRNA (uracil-5-)-methyltransferase TRM9
MRNEIIAKLTQLNRDFYTQFAQSFADSRASSEPGLMRIIKNIQLGNRVLDLGCGQGRLAGMLPEGTIYTGMDFSLEMLVEAKKRAAAYNAMSTFVLGDLMDESLPVVITSTSYNWIFIRAVLHHIPSYAIRSQVVRKATSCLATDGVLILANWQFLNVKRLRKRLISWDQLNIESEDIEPGDYLLDWKRDGYGLRYVHLIDEEETRKLAKDADLLIQDLFLADGHTNNITLYAWLTKG